MFRRFGSSADQKSLLISEPCRDQGNPFAHVAWSLHLSGFERAQPEGGGDIRNFRCTDARSIRIIQAQEADTPHWRI
jgi:hypothetical protein